MTNPQPTHRSLTGIVTKLVGDGATYGFINDEIFFPQTNVVSDGPASVGDQVFAECEYSAHLPIKWNATSVKILSKAAVGQANNAPDRSQQELVNQQQQQPFNQAPSVAVTYQQHRQQRQQRQMLDINKQQDDNKSQLPQQNEPPANLMDQNAGDFYGAGIGSRGFPQQPQPQMAQQQDGNIPPFQDQPMGPPNFTFTSQPGSAFVQPQFLPPAFLPQQPPPLLPQSQHLLPNNQAANNNQRSNVHNKNGPGGNRYNNMDKNDRQQNRRNQNRNENKFDRPRSGDRDGPIDRSRGNNSRDRSVGRGGKRDGPSRPSPPHSSARSPTSSDRGTKSLRRHYEPQNIPKTRIMANMNAYNMKQRCPTSVHVPSDLKDIIVNKHFRLDIKNTPKPLKFVIESSKKNEPGTMLPEANESDPKPDTSEDKSQETDTPQDQDKQTEAKSGDEDGPAEQEVSEKPETKTMDRPSSKSDLRLNHKYGVKVILISIPEFDAIYRKVFGDDLDSFSSESKSRSRLDESITLLCNKGTNNGHSLIGGKFDPTLDGFIEGKNNRFERHGRQPDLIATCKRVVLEQTGLDLGSCRGWNLLSTFIYNNKSDYFSPKASVEYSFIYMPQIWTMMKEISENSTSISIGSAPVMKEQIFSEQAEEQSTTSDTQMQESHDTPVEQTELDVKEETGQLDEERVPNDPETQEPESVTTAEALDSVPSIHDMKRDDLKVELDKRGIKYKTNAKKSELLELLEGSLNGAESVSEDTSKIECDEPPQNPQLEEGEVIENDPSEDSSNGCSESDAAKRKAEDFEESESKRIRVEPDEVDIKPANKNQRVELISEAFVVKSREEQQLSLVSLHEASQVSRHDQFELSVASNILKESLIQHLSEYILTTLIEENRQQSSGNSSSSQQNSQESNSLGSDTNNNNATKSLPKSSNQPDSKLNSKEYPVDRYINLAFSYFDSTHMGYVYSDDLNKLFNNTNLTISKRALSSLLGDSEKFNYRTLPDLSPKLPATYIYEFPEQFRSLSDSSSETESSTAKMIEFKGVVYDVEKLIQEVKDAETLRVSMVDRFNYAIENSDKHIEEIHVLEVSQKSLSKAIKAQNDEICDLKRDRDSIKKKYENIRKGIKSSISNLSELIKEEK